MPFPRNAGILLHPTSLPGPGGIGSIGAAARAFADTLHAAGMGLWQILPLGPTGYGDSPYQSFSAFAGNPLLIDLGELATAGLLDPEEIAAMPPLPSSRVDFGAVIPAKMQILRSAYARLAASHSPDVDTFEMENAFWMDDFALFMALKDRQGGAPWNEWPEPLRARDEEALAQARSDLADDIGFYRFTQFMFATQWQALKSYANTLGIKIIGDIPIFVAYDSADVWAHQELFRLTPEGVPEVVAGVPPDYFSATGQLWGNPHYRWDVMERNGFAWWIDRFRVLLRMVDIVRLDHFRGFAASWQVPFGNPTAETGEWVPTPGAQLFEALRDALGELPIIAEDLGVITPDVVELRLRFGFPGMYILQFAFGSGPGDPSLPHNIERNSVIYTGTHDNDTSVGWYASIDPRERAFATEYCGTRGLDIAWDLIHLALASVADMAVVPLQDVLRLGTSARMNMPGRMAGNWGWRFQVGDITPEHVHGLRYLSTLYGRTNTEPASTIVG